MKLRDQLPSLEGATQWLNGGEIRREDLIGKKIVLVHFWSVSCKYCKITMPTISRLRDEFQDELQIISVHMPRTEEDLYIDDVKRDAITYDISGPIYIDNDHILSDLYSIRFVPAYYLFDRMGKLRYLHAGEGGMRILTNRIYRMID